MLQFLVPPTASELRFYLDKAWVEGGRLEFIVDRGARAMFEDPEIKELLSNSWVMLYITANFLPGDVHTLRHSSMVIKYTKITVEQVTKFLSTARGPEEELYDCIRHLQDCVIELDALQLLSTVFAGGAYAVLDNVTVHR